MGDREWVMKHLEYLRTAPRNERGLTEGQAERHEVEVEMIRLDWMPRTRALAEDLGVDETTAIQYWRLLIDFQRFQLEEARFKSTADTRAMIERAEDRLRRLEDDADEGWRG